MYSNIPLVNPTAECSHQIKDVLPHKDSTVILQQFILITQELQKFTDEVSGNPNKIAWACTKVQENNS